MAMQQKIRNRLDEITAALKESKAVSLADKDDFIEIMSEAAEGTNGLTVEEKTQANSVNIFNLCYLFMRDKLEGGPRGFWQGLFHLIERCSWQIVVIVAIIAVAVIFRPEIAEVIKAAIAP